MESFELSDYVPGVSYNFVSKKWRVRATSSAQPRLYFGEYSTKEEADEVGEQVLLVNSRAEGFRVREALGIKGHGNIAKLQRHSLAKDRSRLKQREAKARKTLSH